MVAEPRDLNTRGKVENKREYFRLDERLRIEVQTIKLLENKIAGETRIERMGKLAECVTTDISAGGLQFFSHGHYRGNTYVEITLHFKKTDRSIDPVKVIARIVRSEQVEHSQSHNISVEYVNINSKDRSHIERYIFLRQREMIAEKRIGSL